MATSGVCHFSAFCGYVDMSRDLEMGAHQLFEFDLDSESDNE